VPQTIAPVFCFNSELEEAPDHAAPQHAAGETDQQKRKRPCDYHASRNGERRANGSRDRRSGLEPDAARVNGYLKSVRTD
jgi:hypothetical protein